VKQIFYVYISASGIDSHWVKDFKCVDEVRNNLKAILDRELRDIFHII
jgi:hypothetical protein